MVATVLSTKLSYSAQHHCCALFFFGGIKHSMPQAEIIVVCGFAVFTVVT